MWQGSAFDCPLSLNEISLRHSDFARMNARGECNDGAIVAQAQSVTGEDCFNSQLMVLVSPSMQGQTLQCHYDNGLTMTMISVIAINLTRGEILNSDHL